MSPTGALAETIVPIAHYSRCAGCNVPLCSVGTGHVDQDCFTLCHESDTTREMVIRKFEAMQKKTNKRFLP